MHCRFDRELCRAYLLNQLKSLYTAAAKTSKVNLESAGIEGGIVELEAVWHHLFKEDMPSKQEILDYHCN